MQTQHKTQPPFNSDLFWTKFITNINDNMLHFLLKLKPDSKHYQITNIRHFFDKRNYDGAYNCLLQLEYASEFSSDYYFYTICLQLALGQYFSAQRNCQYFLNQHANNQSDINSIKLLLAYAKIKLGYTFHARETLKEIPDTCREQVNTLNSLLFIQENEMSNPSNAQNDNLTVLPNSYYSQIYLDCKKMVNELNSNTLTVLSNAILQYPRIPSFYLLHAQYYEKSYDFYNMSITLLSAKTQFPYNQEIYLALIRCYILLDDFRSAKNVADECKYFFPEDRMLPNVIKKIWQFSFPAVSNSLYPHFDRETLQKLSDIDPSTSRQYSVIHKQQFYM